jgi:zinc/manganese transport system permease protein
MEHLLLQVEILWPAMIAGMIILSTHVPLGREVLQRGIIFLDLAIAQIAAFGVVAANILWISDDSTLPQTLIAILAAIIGALSLYKIRRLEVRVQESIIGILFILAATGSILLLSADPHGGEQLKKILVGQILWLQPQELLSLFIVYTIIFCIWRALKHSVGEWLFYPLFAVTITLSTQVIGVYLVFASLIIPSLVTLSHKKPMLKAFAIGTLGYALGLIFSAIFDLPAGAAIVWSLALIAMAYYLLCRTLIKDN